MMRIEARLKELGLVLPAALQTPPGLRLPFTPARVRGNRVYLSGAIAIEADGRPSQVLGKVGNEVTVEQGYESARKIALGHIAALQRALGDLDRVTAWLRVHAMINAAPGFNNTPAVANGYSDLIIQLWGDDAGAHARSAVGMAVLPLNAPVEIEAEVEIDA
jgi:enamine deaminase RidA (YjgF/YER057c/UK114 family)